MRLHLRHGDSVPTIHKYRRPKIFVYEKFPKTEDRRYSLMKNFRRPKTEYLRSWKISEDRRPNSTIRSQLFANTEESKYSVQLCIFHIYSFCKWNRKINKHLYLFIYIIKVVNPDTFFWQWQGKEDINKIIILIKRRYRLNVEHEI